METTKGAGLCVGVSRFDDAALAGLPAAADSARKVEACLDRKLFRTISALIDPTTNDELFVALQKAMQKARGATFFLYFAGHALVRDGELLLAVRSSEVAGARGCVPWSDVIDLLRRERVASALLVLNVDHPAAGAGAPEVEASNVAAFGSLRAYDARTADARLGEYAAVLLEALEAPATELSAFLEDGQLLAGGLAQYVEGRAAKSAAHASFAMSDVPVALRALADELAAAALAPAVPAVEAAPPEVAEAPAAPEAAPAETDVAALAKADAAPPQARAEAPVERVSTGLSRRPRGRSSNMPYLLLAAAIAAAVLYWLLRS